MLLLVIVIIAISYSWALRRGWPLAVRLQATWLRARPGVVGYVRGSPGTFAYLVILAVTTMVMASSSRQVVLLLLREHSTNLHQLIANPLRVLILSAFWAPNYQFLVWAILFALVLAPAERWLGTRRWLLVFAVGHVMATLGVAWGLWIAIRHGYASRHLENAIDVGVSYGFAAVAAVFTYRLTSWRWLWAASLGLVAILALALGRTFTDAGHLLAVGVGFACYPLTKGAAIASRSVGPIWSTRSSATSDPPP